MIEPTLPTPQEVLMGVGGDHPELRTSTIAIWSVILKTSSNFQKMFRIEAGPFLDELTDLETAGLIRVDIEPDGPNVVGWIDASSSWATIYLQAVSDLEKI